jgi:hypothetical protein
MRKVYLTATMAMATERRSGGGRAPLPGVNTHLGGGRRDVVWEHVKSLPRRSGSLRMPAASAILGRPCGRSLGSDRHTDEERADDGYDISFREAAVREAQVGSACRYAASSLLQLTSKGRRNSYTADAVMILASENVIGDYLRSFVVRQAPPRIFDPSLPRSPPRG